MKAIDIGIIQARRAKLISEMECYRDAIVTLKAKLAELEIAERVFAELSLESDSISYATTLTASNAAPIEITGSCLPNEEHEKVGEPAGKPEWIPSVPDMIIEALTHAQALGSPGLKPKELTSYIRGRYWPNAPDIAVGPIAWRMFKRGELGKNGSTYMLLTSSQSTESDDAAELKRIDNSEEAGRKDLETQSSLCNGPYSKEPTLFRQATTQREASGD